jgi:hypothetical protein
MTTDIFKTLKEEGQYVADRYDIVWDKVEADISLMPQLEEIIGKISDLEEKYREVSDSRVKPSDYDMGPNQFVGYIIDLQDTLIDAYASRDIYHRIKAVLSVTSN